MQTRRRPQCRRLFFSPSSTRFFFYWNWFAFPKKYANKLYVHEFSFTVRWCEGFETDPCTADLHTCCTFSCTQDECEGGRVAVESVLKYESRHRCFTNLPSGVSHCSKRCSTRTDQEPLASCTTEVWWEKNATAEYEIHLLSIGLARSWNRRRTNRHTRQRHAGFAMVKIK